MTAMRTNNINAVMSKHILSTLAEESRWLTFDELYSRAQIDSDWRGFAEVLEGLVEQGRVQYTLPIGADTGFYRIVFTGTANEHGGRHCDSIANI